MFFQYLPFIIFSLLTLIALIYFLNTSYREKNTIFFLCIYLICVWWLIYQPHELFGSDIYLKHYFYFHSAKIVYEPAGLTSSGAFLNIAMTIPGGIFLNLLFKDHLNWFSILLISIFIGFFNESTQFIFDLYLNLKRTVDITDVITNSLGILIGYICIKYGISTSTQKNQT